jgi:uncharacterized protein
VLGIDPVIVLFGLGVGILIGLTGIGGGSLMTPLLIIVLGVQPTVAVGTDLAYGAVTKTAGGWRHLRKGTVDVTVSKWLAFGSLPGALLGVVLIDRLRDAYGKDFDHVLLAFVAGALVIVATTVLVRTFLLGHLAASERETFKFTTRTRIAAIAMGFVLGMILGLTSVGSGALVGVALIVLFRLTPRRVVGTDVFHAALLLWVAGLAHLVSGNVDFGLMGNILIGSIPGVWIGAHFIDRVPAQRLRVVLGAVLLGSALAMIKNAGGEIPIGVIFGVPVGVIVAGFLLQRRSPEQSADVPGRPGADLLPGTSPRHTAPTGAAVSVREHGLGVASTR